MSCDERVLAASRDEGRPAVTRHEELAGVARGERAPRVEIRDLVAYFLRLGTLGFGGPAALCGQMEKELVQERGWITRTEFRDSLAVCQSLPGPLAIQVGILLAYLRAGFWGAWAGGWAFILPNFILVAALGALYVHLHALPMVSAVFYGVSPAVIALILHSCYRLIKLGMEDRLQWVIAAGCFIVTIAMQAEVALLFIAAGAIGIAYYGTRSRRSARVAVSEGTSAASSTPAGIAPGRPSDESSGASPRIIFMEVAPTVPLSAGFAAKAVAVPAGSVLAKLAVFFLKAGSLTFGSGLVIVPFLEKGLVQQMGWLNEQQFLVAVAMGMLSPGPVVITATFVGYLVAGLWGSVVSTIGIFLPSFLLVLIVAPIMIRHRENPTIRGFVKGAYAAAIGTILGAGVLLGKIAIGDWLTALIAAASLAALVRWKISNPVLVVVTAVIGVIGFEFLRPAWVFVK